MHLSLLKVTKVDLDNIFGLISNMFAALDVDEKEDIDSLEKALLTLGLIKYKLDQVD